MSIFISYRRDDTEWIVDQIRKRLAEEFGDDHVFVDVEGIQPGEDFFRKISHAVGECKVLLAVVGRNWFAVNNETGARRLDDPKDFVRLEIEAALERGIPVIPVMVGDARIPRSEDLPPGIQPLVRRNGLPVRRDAFDFDVNRLVKSVKEIVEPPDMDARLQSMEKKVRSMKIAVGIMFCGVTIAIAITGWATMKYVKSLIVDATNKELAKVKNTLKADTIHNTIGASSSRTVEFSFNVVAAFVVPTSHFENIEEILPIDPKEDIKDHKVTYNIRKKRPNDEVGIRIVAIGFDDASDVGGD